MPRRRPVLIEPVSRPPGMPSTIGRYRIVGRLGRGAMGVVYSARDDQLDREVALKVMMTDLESDPETRARFYREAQITSKLLHRNIITVFDLGEDNGRLYLVMELLRGRTLTDFLKDPESHTLEQKLDLMVQTCEGLSVAHANGVVHRDVKPTNLFVQPDGALKILDFGIARLASSSMTASGLIVGTPDYMSPEQAQGKDVDARSDVFSAGGVFYFMLTGRRPFDAASLPLVLQKVVREEPLPIREHEAPPALAQVIARALSKDPGQRYQRFADMTAELVRFKRSYDTETRRLVASARECFERACRLLSSEREWRGALALDVSESIGELERSLRERYPFFSVEPGRVPPAPVPAGRGWIVAILDDLNSTLAPLSARVDALAAAVAAVEAGEKALEAHDASGAVVHFQRAAGSIAEESPRIATGASSALAAVSARRELEARVHSLVAEARVAERRGDWPAVADLCARVLAIQPQMADARVLASKARVALEAAADVRARQVQKLLGQAGKAIQSAQFADADRLLNEAHALQIDAEAVKAVRARLTEARVKAAALDASPVTLPSLAPETAPPTPVPPTPVPPTPAPSKPAPSRAAPPARAASGPGVVTGARSKKAALFGGVAAVIVLGVILLGLRERSRGTIETPPGTVVTPVDAPPSSAGRPASAVGEDLIRTSLARAKSLLEGHDPDGALAVDFDLRPIVPGDPGKKSAQDRLAEVKSKQ